MAAVTPPASAGSRAFGTGVLVALVVLLAWQLAYWTWRFAAPAAVARAAESRGDVDPAAIAKLFGASAPSSSGGATAGLRLKGVIAPTPGVAASAIFSTGSGKDLAVFLDAEVVPGVKLAEVHPEYVIVTRAGVPTRIDLEARRALAAGSRPGALSAGFHLDVAHASANQFAFARKELDEALRDPNQLNYLGQIDAPAGGGVRMAAAPAGSLAAKLGLQPGDVIKRINGQAVGSPGDLARLYQQFANLSLIEAEVQRGSATLQLSYRIQ
jgi:general secretion pathway protein C